MSKKILFKFPTRSRPEKFFKCLDNIIDNIGYDNYQILVSVDNDDKSMCNGQVLSVINHKYHNKVRIYFGHSKNKIDAVNRDVSNYMSREGFDILLCHSDDMWYIKKDFGLDIIDAFENYSGVVHFPDQVAKEKLITYAMMSKDYYELDGWIYNPLFESVYADNWQQDLASKRGKYKYVDKEILEHRHFIWGYGVQDELAKQTENPILYAKDKATYDELIKTL